MTHTDEGNRFGRLTGSQVKNTAFLAALARLLPLILSGCRPSGFSRPSAAVAFLDSMILEDELRTGDAVVIHVRADEALPIVEIKVGIPAGVITLGVFASLGESHFKRSADGKTFQNKTHGEIPIGGMEVFGIPIQSEEATAGDVFSFPVELRLSDSSVVEWTGPPGSERPAPTVTVGASPPRASRSLIAVAGVIALLALASAGPVRFWPGIRKRPAWRT
jgi:hypothetical protein